MELQKRKPNRLKNYDYSQSGIYFITICTNNRKPILSKIENNADTVGANCVRPSAIGLIIEKEILIMDSVYDNVKVDNYVIMPNHIHLLIRIEDSGRTQFAPTINRIIKQFKGSITKQIGQSIWQKSFYDHIIRDDEDYLIKAQYINDNPSKWLDDELFCENNK